MNLYLNSKQEKFLKDLINKPGLEILGEYDNAEQLLQELSSKLNKKKIDTKAKLPSAIFVDKTGKEITFSPRKDNGALILKANKSNYPDKYNGYFKFEWSLETITNVVNFLHEYTLFTGDNDYEVYANDYCEEINVFKDGVERSISISGSKMAFICYTDDNNDDDWTYLLPNRVKEVLRLIIPYIFLHKDKDNYFNLLHVDIQNKYIDWLEKQKK